MRKFNKELLLKVKEQILKEPKQFIMHKFFSDSLGYGELIKKEIIPNCGTAACIAGWAISIAKEMNPQYCRGMFYPERYNETAMELLGLSIDDANTLFSAGNWPDSFAKQWYDNIFNLEVRAKVAAQVIDAFIEKKEKELAITE